MEPKFNNSFIPKKSLSTAARPRRKASANILLIVAVIVFFFSILAAAGAFLYGQYLGIDIERKQEQLDRARGAFEPSLINELTRLDDRLEASQRILDAHLAPTRFFDFMTENTLETVRFQSVTLTPSLGNTMNLVMSGEARSFASVALQSDVFKKSSMLLEPIIFTGFSVNQFGRVSFNVSATVDRRELLYQRALRTPKVENEFNEDSF